jgi:hypothetical protein
MELIGEAIYVELPIDKLRPNSWNPNQMTDEMFGKALNSITEFGFIDPITVMYSMGCTRSSMASIGGERRNSFT